MKKLLLAFFTIHFFIPVNAQLPESEVWLFSYTSKNSYIDQDNGKNISNNPGYDNQPFFSADSKSMLWTSQRDSSQTDIFSYNLSEHVSLRLTQTKVSEYSPEFIPGSHYFSAVVVEPDSTQRLWKYDLSRYDTISKPSELMFPEIKNIAYSRWFNTDLIFLCVLPEPMNLICVNVSTGAPGTAVEKNVGRALQSYSWKKKKWLLYTKMNVDSSFSIHSWDIKGNTAFSPVPCLAGSQDFVADQCGHILMAKDAKIFSWTIGKSTQWQEVADLSKNGLHRITRMAISPNGKNIAFVDNIPLEKK
ncbi:MAG: hypothetical protein M3R17_18620 [Bacteroidota bacterium]|nr:hypothetical protein [Bacteroidota bacterium]